MLTIANLSFSIDTASLDAFIDEEDMSLNWGIDIHASTQQVDRVEWKPSIHCEILLKTRLHELSHWCHLAGRNVGWDTALDDDGEPYATLYVFEHHPLYNNRVQLLANSDGHLLLTWHAQCDVHWNERYGTALDLSLRTPLTFTGIWCGRGPEVVCRQHVAAYFPLNVLQYTQTETGVSLYQPLPRNDDRRNGGL